MEDFFKGRRKVESDGQQASNTRRNKGKRWSQRSSWPPVLPGSGFQGKTASAGPERFCFMRTDPWRFPLILPIQPARTPGRGGERQRTRRGEWENCGDVGDGDPLHRVRNRTGHERNMHKQVPEGASDRDRKK